MRSLLLTLLLLIGAFTGYADPVDPILAKRVGEHFLSHWTGQQPLDFKTALELAETGTATMPGSSKPIHCYYLFRNLGGGFVIVAADDRVQPILGYGTEGEPFPLSAMPEHVSDWLLLYRDQIAEAIAQRISPEPQTIQWWNALKEGSAPSYQGQLSTVNPLIAAKWDQSPHYNALAPFDNAFNQRTVAGCVATAMAMIMKYYNYPSNGTGFHSYTHEKYGLQSANFGATTYNYAAMPNTVNSPNAQVATLMYHCGVAVDMMFGVGSTGGSGAYVISAKSPVQHCAEYAFRTYFGYKPSLKGVERSSYTQTQWINLLKTELDASRPVYYAGFGSGGGHAFLCDGYDANNFFHFNWGWSGSFNGYFTVNALNPSGVGTGGGSGGYNSGQQAIIGLEPLAQSDPDPVPGSFNMVLNNFIFLSANPLQYGQGFSVTTNFANLGSNNFAGDYCAAVFDDEYNFVDFVEIKTGLTLQAGFTYTNNLVFTTPGLLSLVPGDYYVGIFYRPAGGDWEIATDNGNFKNIVPLDVRFSNTIEMYSDFITTPGPNFIQGQAATANLNLLNAGNSTFFGEYQVNLYGLDGAFVTTFNTISENNGLPPNFVYLSPFLTFSKPQLNVEPGTYLLAVLFKPSFSSNWSLVGSTEHSNPIRVNVVSPAIQPDPYEVNNSAGQAHTFPVNYSNNTAKILTTGSNLHIGSDLDFYRINLASGFQYSVQARAHDSWDSGDGKTYTCDVLFSISTNGGASWGEAWDDVMDGSINLVNGGNVLFQVAPYFVGETGTYLLDITVVRSPLSSTEEPAELAGFRLFPNPARGRVTLDTGDYGGRVHTIQLIAPDGRETALRALPAIGGQLALELPDTPAGIYYLRLITDHGILTRKLSIQ
jgi:hypothetical protein